jgi:hypothetical protein
MFQCVRLSDPRFPAVDRADSVPVQIDAQALAAGEGKRGAR